MTVAKTKLYCPVVPKIKNRKRSLHRLHNTCAVQYYALDLTEIPQMRIQMICTFGSLPEKSTTLRFYFPPPPAGKKIGYPEI